MAEPVDVDALLAQLAPLHAPQPSPWPAWGWWLLGIMVVVLLFVVYRRWRERARRLAWRVTARRELADIRQQLAERPAAESLAALSVLCRRVSMVALPRGAIASVHGDAWLTALDRLATTSCFSDMPARLLATHAYQREPDIDSVELEAIADCVEHLIRAVAKQSAESTA